MKSTAHSKASSRRADPPARSPLSVTLSDGLRKRLAKQAKRRELKLATAARVLLAEHIEELEDDAQLSRAEAWQRAQAWATWEKIKSGDVREVSWDDLRRETEQALEQAKARARAK